MGHIFFLYDTHIGTSIYDSSNCAEAADGSNGNTCGDYIADTPADPGLYFLNVNPNDCSFNPQFYDIPLIDPISGLNYAPDTGNIMSLTSPNCYTNFTLGQKKRMKNAIWYIPVLHSTLLDKWNYIRNNEEDCYVCGTKSFTFYTNNDASYFNVLENSNNVSVSITPIDPFSAAVTVTNLNPNSTDEGSSGYFLIGHHINDTDNVRQPIWVGLPQTVEDSQMSGTDYIANAGDGFGNVLENNKWLGGTDYYTWSLPTPYHPVHYYDFDPDDTIWQYVDYAKHFFFVTGDSGEQTGKVAVHGTNPCGEGGFGLYNELCIVNADDPEGDSVCDPLPTPIYYYPNPASSLLEIDLSLQPYKIFDVVIYDENQTVKYSDQSTNVIKTVDTFNLVNGTYYLHIYDSSDVILSAILIINH